MNPKPCKTVNLRITGDPPSPALVLEVLGRLISERLGVLDEAGSAVPAVEQ